MKLLDLLNLFLFLRLLEQLPRFILHGVMVWLTVLGTLLAVANHEIQQAVDQHRHQDESKPAQIYLNRRP